MVLLMQGYCVGAVSRIVFKTSSCLAHRANILRRGPFEIQNVANMSESIAVKPDDSVSNPVRREPSRTSSSRKRVSIPGMIEEESSLEVATEVKIGKNNDTAAELQKSVLVNDRYQCPWPTWEAPKFLNVVKFMLSKDHSNVPQKTELDELLPIVKPNFDSIPKTGVSVTWIGHATTLVQFDGATILTDPIFSNRCSPMQWFGPKRYRNPPCTIGELPEVDAVVISHSHYDHLDVGSVKQLNERFGSKLRWFVPMKLASWMKDMGCENVVELDWWESATISDDKNMLVVLTPAQHWSKRTLFDDFRTLWGSWCIIGPKHRFFFAGDTGYCEVFKHIGQKFGPFDLAAIPIGAYEPRWFMQYQHVNPEDAVKIHEDVASKCSIGIHWGTFALANEFYLAPPKDLQESLEKSNIPSEQFITLKHGETKHIQAQDKNI